MNHHIVQNFRKISRILPPNWSADIANEDHREKSRLTKESQRFDTPHIKLQLGQDEIPFEDYLIMKGEDIIEVEYCMSKLVDMTLGQRIKPPRLDLNAKPLDFLDVDE